VLRQFGHSLDKLFKVTKVIDFGTNRKHICNFLLVYHSNLGRMFYRFGDIVGFYDPE